MSRRFFANNSICRLWWPVLIFLVLGYCLYVQTFGHGWTGDDFPVIVENPDIRSWGGFLENLYPSRPLREITYLLDHALFGLEPWGYRIQNIFWHALNAGLVFFLSLRLGLERRAAWVVALLFLCHPIMVEVVANTSHRKDSLALAFSLTAVLAFSEAFRAQEKKVPYLLLSLALGVLAFFAKQTAVALVPVALAYLAEFVPCRRRILLLVSKFLVLVAAVLCALGLVWLWAGRGGETFAVAGSGILGKMNYFGEWDGGLYARTVLKGWAFMFLRLVLPLNLAMEYTYPLPVSWGDGWVLAAALLSLASLVGLIASFRKQPLVFFALVWFWAFWLPTSNLWPLAYFAADRYLYAPMVGFLLLFGFCLERLTKCSNAAVALVAVCLLPAAACLTWQQSRSWHGPETLWAQAHRVSPDSAFVLNNMGNIHFERGELPLALDFYQQAAAQNPYNPTTQFNLGLIFERYGDRRQALRHFENFLRIDNPKFKDQQTQVRDHLRQRYRAVP